MTAAVRSAILGIFACGVLGLVSSSLAADNTAYLSLSGGGDFPAGDLGKSDITSSETGEPIPDYDISLDWGWEGALTLGFFVKNFRIEGQYTVQQNEFDEITNVDAGTKEDATGKLHSNLFMLNAYYDLPMGKNLSAYAGAGAGVAYVEHEGDSLTHSISDQHGASFAYQMMLGMEYKLSPMISIFGGYRGWTALDLDTQQATLDIPWFHLAEAGLRVSF